jgi:hypothetical protein
MTLPRRWLIALIGCSVPLLLTTADASAARHRARPRAAQVTTATYHATARPHAPHRLRAGSLHNRRFAQTARRAALIGG